MSQVNLRARKADPGRLPMVGAQGASMGKDQGGKGTGREGCGREGDHPEAWGCLGSSFAGISRSTTIVIAYVMTVTGLGWREILEAIKATRPIANPNPGFRQQLEEFGWGNSQKVGTMCKALLCRAGAGAARGLGSILDLSTHWR